MRLRLPELLTERNMTAYGLHKASDGRISMSAAYRLMRAEGRVQFFDADLLEALCTALGVTPGDLFERETAAGKRPVAPAKKSARKAATKSAARKVAKA